MEKTIVLKLAKETTGTLMYNEVTPGQPVRTVYVNKGTWDPMPKEIELKISPKK